LHEKYQKIKIRCDLLNVEIEKSENSLDKELKKNYNLEHEIKINSKNLEKLENKIEVLIKENKDLLFNQDETKKMYLDYDIIQKSNHRFKNEISSFKEESKKHNINIKE